MKMAMTAAALCGVALMLALETAPAPSVPSGLPAARPAETATIAIADVPKSFQGAAIGLITAGLMSLAFMGFAGMIHGP